MAKKEIPLEVAKKTAYKIVDTLDQYCENIAVVGSIRRRQPIVHDIDIVLIPQTFMWDETIPTKLKKILGAKIIRNGPLIKQLQIDGINVDLVHATTQNWGIRMLRWTGSTAHNIMLCKRARSLGMKLAVSEGLLDKDQNLLEAQSEAAIFKHLGLEYIEPENREANK